MTAAVTTPNFSQVKAAITGSIKFAPLGSTVPTDVTSSWAAAWVDLGTIDDKGITDSLKQTYNAVAAWQSVVPVRQLQKSAAPSIKFAALQLNWATMQAYYGALASTVSAGLYKISFPPTVLVNEWMLGIEFKDGAYTYRKWFPRGVFTDPADITLEKGTAIMPGLTYSVLGTDLSTDVITFLTNDPAFASS